MQIEPTALPGVMRIGAVPHGDARGQFARLYCPQEFADAGIDFTPSQINLSTNPQAMTLRGLHFQKPPYAESKLVRVVQGRAFDVVVDLRPGPTQGKCVAEELSADAMNALFLPEGVAHGFLTLEPGTSILYQMGRNYVPGQADGLRWDDPDLAIDWPRPPDPETLSEQDRSWPGIATRSDLQGN